MKQTIKKWMCRLFGHRMYEEVYAERVYGWFFKGAPLYNVVRSHTCERCGKTHRRVLCSGIRRSQLLKEGWFIEQ